MNIIPRSDLSGSHRTGTLMGIGASTINDILGFEPNVDDDPHKVKYSWGFTVDGVVCGIWDYKDSSSRGIFSTFGPHEIFKKLFPNHYP